MVYRQNWLVPYLGFTWERIPSPGGWRLTLRASPAVFTWDEDLHEQKQLNYVDTLSGGILIEPQGALTWEILPGLIVAAGAEYRGVFNLRGTVASIDYSQVPNLTSAAPGTAGVTENRWTIFASAQMGL